MKDIKIPIESEAHFVIGNIYVDVSINFRPMMRVDDKERIVTNAFQARLDRLALEVRGEVQKLINKAFEDTKGV